MNVATLATVATMLIKLIFFFRKKKYLIEKVAQVAKVATDATNERRNL